MREYFIQLLNGSEISEVGGNVSRGRIGGNERVVREVLREEILNAIKMKDEKAAVWVVLL